MKRIVRRMDGVAEEVTKPVEVSKLVEPQFLTLVGKPANQVGFKILRTDQEKDTPMTQDVADTRRRRVRATKRSSLLTIEFPEGTTEAEIEVAVEQYGLEGYELVQEGDSKKLCLRRSDLTETPQNTVAVKLNNGVVARILRSEPEATPPVHSAISVIAIEFKKDHFADEASAMEVITRFDIDFLEKGIENTDTCIRVVRSEVAEDADVRRVEVEPGVIAVVARADTADMGTENPNFVEVVSETAYGSWGWGQLDFVAAMADYEFCEAAEEATSYLNSTIRRILYYSELPTSIRKDLVARAAGQFSAYIGTLLDGLPTKVVMINRSSVEQKEQRMTKKVEDKGAEGQAAGSQETEAPITRSELASMIATGIAEALAAQKGGEGEGAGTEEVTRSDDSAKGEEKQAGGTDGKVMESLETVTRSVGDIAEALKGLSDRFTKIEGSTIARSDSQDDAVSAPTKDVFAGAFSFGHKAK